MFLLLQFRLSTIPGELSWKRNERNIGTVTIGLMKRKDYYCLFDVDFFVAIFSVTFFFFFTQYNDSFCILCNYVPGRTSQS
jgi:hypothetical protein